MRGSRERVAKRNFACRLRETGWSYREISIKLRISKNTAYLWTHRKKLSVSGIERIKKISQDAKRRSETTQAIRAARKRQLLKEEERQYFRGLGAHRIDSVNRLLCAMIYWCEGAKTKSSLILTNSDPNLVKYFLSLFRSAYHLEEHKFRVVMHLHQYHDVQDQMSFWSRVTGIPPSQFTKPYIKSNTGKIQRPNYPGCIALKYYDASLAQRLMDLASIAMSQYSDKESIN